MLMLKKKLTSFFSQLATKFRIVTQSQIGKLEIQIVIILKI